MQDLNIEYDRYNRIIFNSEIHFNHNKAWLMQDQLFLIENYIKLGMRDCCYALGRTEATLADKVQALRKNGIMPLFKKGEKKRLKCN